MHDLPSQTLLQQANARPVSGEELEVFGKTAASRFMMGKSPSLNDSVVETVKQAGLSPEQVKRVIEFANTAAYLQEFKKEGSTHKYIHFHGGPASPTEILKDLNDGGGGTVFDRGTSDYGSPPPKMKSASAQLEENEELSKTAGATDDQYRASESAAADPVEQAFMDMFHVDEQPLPYAEPWNDVEAMREKLATTRDNLTSELSMVEGEFRDITDQLYGLVKQAAADGVPLSHILQAWSHVTPGEGFVKAAFTHIGPRLAKEEVMSLSELGESLTKQAAAGVVNPQHPIVGTFAGFCSHLMKLADVREQRDVCHQEFQRVDGFIKQALNATQAAGAAKAGGGLLRRVVGKKGLWGGAKSLASKASEKVEPTVRGVGEAVLGEGSRGADLLARGAGGATKYAPHIALGAGGLAAAQEASDQLTYNPTLQPVGRALTGAKQTALSYMPLVDTDAKMMRRQMIAGGGFGPTSMMGAYT